MGLLDQLGSFAQGASNSIAGGVSAPVDGIAWLLRKAGVPVPSNPVGGSDWMAQQGLTAAPKNHMAGLLGEGIGGALPSVAAARAPQIAGGLLQMGENAMARATMNSQAGAINVKALADQFPNVKFDLMQRDNNATLGRLIVPPEQRGQGIGTKFMGELSRAADVDGATVALSPSADFGGNKNRLIDFYKQFGFVPNKGRNIDYALSESMYRTPKK